MASVAQMQTWLTEAETALHSLYMGDAIVQVTAEGRTVIYKQTDTVKLESYIAKLTNKINGYNRSPIVPKL